MDNSQTYNCMNPAFNGYPPQLSQEQNLVLQNTTIYEDIRSPTSIPSSDNATLKNFQAWPSQKIIITGINKKTKCCIATPICLALLLCLLLAGTAALAVITYLEVRLLKMEANNMPVIIGNEDLMMTVQNLEQQLIEMNETYHTKIFELETNFNDKIDNIQIYNLSSNVIAEIVVLVTELNTTQGRLWYSLANLTARADTELDIYEDCSQETISCNQSGDGNNTDYTRECYTEQVDINTTGHYTTDMHCEVTTTAASHYLHSATLLTEDNRTRCQCSVIKVNATTGNIEELPSTLDLDCTLLITRCPLLLYLP